MNIFIYLKMASTFFDIKVTNAVFLGTPPPGGFGFSQFGIAGGYGTPIVSTLAINRGNFLNILDRSPLYLERSLVDTRMIGS
jgi:hypothetical protein